MSGWIQAAMQQNTIVTFTEKYFVLGKENK